jgi:hypothetical protein
MNIRHPLNLRILREHTHKMLTRNPRLRLVVAMAAQPPVAVQSHLEHFLVDVDDLVVGDLVRHGAFQAVAVL